MNQCERVLDLLKHGPVCGTVFLKLYIPRYSARILELRQRGHVITTRPCKDQWHGHQSPQTLFELAETDQLRLAL